ncbi:geranyl diphosphate diphosphatase [Sarracenia purpurea var. burkii]
MACMRSIWSASESWAVSGVGSVVGAPRIACSWRTTRNFPRRRCLCMTLPSPPISKTTIGENNDSLLATLPHPQPQVFPSKVDDGTNVIELEERTQRALRNATETTGAMKLIDTIQRLGIGYLFEEEINELLQPFSETGAHLIVKEDDLFTTALCFRLLRHNGYRISSDVFQKFVDNDGKFKQSLRKDVEGMLSLYEASYTGAEDEEILRDAMEFTEAQLKQSIPLMAPRKSRNVSQALELPRHLRMERLETRRFIEEYSRESDQSLHLLELAKLDYNKVQSLHRAELAEITRWWKQLGLVEKLSFGRDRPLECYLWTVGILPEPKHSDCRIELAKTIAILLVLDDIFDSYGASLDELVFFTHSIQRWDLSAMEQLPQYMKICYMALFNTTNEIGYKILKKHGWNVVPHLRRTSVQRHDDRQEETNEYQAEQISVKVFIRCEPIEARLFGQGSPDWFFHLCDLIAEVEVRRSEKLQRRSRWCNPKSQERLAVKSAKKKWIDMIEAFLVEAKWFNNGYVPNLEEYLQNGVTTAGSYMALVHIFFLIGHGVTQQTVRMMDPYPNLFSCSGRILRLWDDLGTATDEQERGDVASSIDCLRREKKLPSEGEARSHVKQLIRRLWRELNGEPMAPNPLPLPLIKASFNMSRTSQIIYQHGDDDSFSTVDDCVRSLFFTPIG